MGDKKGADFRNELMEKISILMKEGGCQVTVHYENQNDVEK
jgi:hypothetical protein